MIRNFMSSINLRNFSKLLATLVTSILFTVIPNISSAQFGIVDPKEQQLEEAVGKVGQTLFNINKYYLDTVNFKGISEELVKSVIAKLDPHSSYISAEDVKAMNEPLEGNFDGIGVEFALINDTLTIQATVPGGPSEKVGIKAGDKIVKVDGEIIAGTGLTIERVHKYLRGPKGTKVTVGVVRKGSDAQNIDFVITRDKIPLNSVDAAYEIEPGILYIKLSRFAATSYQEIMKFILTHQGERNGLILDLRGNGGGYLLAALQIANEFLDQGQLMLYTEGRTVRRMSEYANGRGLLTDIPVVVLIDENSASASEIVSGAIQDWDRGTIVGRRSFGKGLVQQQFDLFDGSQLRLTVARYHTPSGRVIQSPYEQGKAEDYYKAFYDRYEKGETFSKDSIHFPDSLKFKTLRLGRTVYGGGGIMPDLFIPADTSHYTPFFGEIVRKGLLADFVNSYVDNNREQLQKRYKTSSQFIASFDVTPKLFDQFLALCKSKGVEPVGQALEISGPELKKYIKAYIIRNLFDFNEYIRFLNTDDIEVEKALEIVKGH
ncbi:MAG: S41 family peptidase [Bacteroidales bacterium]|nr:S41 family peptidase [Bacteroidales bacterium]